jgi:hypothetical protein
VCELGIVIWIFLGWQFTLAEFVGGLLLIVLMWIGVRVVVSRRVEEEEHALVVQAGHKHASAASDRKLLSLQAWSDVAHNFRRRLGGALEGDHGRLCDPCSQRSRLRSSRSRFGAVHAIRSAG